MAYTYRFDRALTYASELHRDHERKGRGVPYITHLLAVASLVGAHHGDEDQVIAALLHDAIEDCIDSVPDIREQIREAFGERVLDIVEGCTDADTIPKPDWPERKQQYLDHLRELPDDSPVLLVSLCDKLHNARAILRDLREHGDALWDRFKGGHGGSLWYYTTLARTFREKRPGHLADELTRTVALIREVGGVPDILSKPDTDNTLLVELLEQRLEGREILDCLDFVVIDFIAEVEPIELTVHADLTIEPASGVELVDPRSDKTAAFVDAARTLADTELEAWRDRGFEVDEEGDLRSAERALSDPDKGMAYVHKATYPAADIDDVADVVRWLEDRELRISLDD